MGYCNGEETITKEMQRQTTKTEHDNGRSKTQDVWGIYEYLHLKISRLSLI